ncbi:Nitric oxide synthase, brain [Aphanomyces cochlioides]|nr:Nitric oxide synthase, brain [Aphanomyces cochlioides]
MAPPSSTGGTQGMSRCPFSGAAAPVSKCPFAVTLLTTNDKVKYDPTRLSAEQKTLYGVGCQENQCQAAMMDKSNQPTVDANRSPDQVWREAYEFLLEYYRDCHPDGLAGLAARAAEVQDTIMSTGTYFQTRDELEYGVRLAWRNASRCIMRIQWRNISLIDARGADANTKLSSHEIFTKCVEHLETTLQEQDGNRVINSLMTVFPQLMPGETTSAKIWNNQLLRFAGYEQPDGSILGDPANVDLTKVAIHLGWVPPQRRTPFDVLPLITQGNAPDAVPVLNELPDHVQVLVDIKHPEYSGIADMKLKWHAVPAISNFCLDVGGIQYPCAPFNGWYMGSEIASRNFLDIQRYNLLEPVAKAMNMDTTAPRSLWQDRAAVELNAAVLYSFQEERLTIIDHHTASESFVRHHAKEMQTRGFIPADWVWIVPPVGGSTTAVFHQEMVNFIIKPTFIMPTDNIRTLLEQVPSAATVVETPEEATLSLVSHPVYIHYGSETGMSESFASAIQSTMASNYVTSICEPLNACDLTKLKGRCSLIIVTSTFGTGGPPANAKTFVDQLSDFQGDLSHVQAYIFGLGSSAYANFNACALEIASHLNRCKANVCLEASGDETKDMKRSFKAFFGDLTVAHGLTVPEHSRLEVTIESSSTPFTAPPTDNRVAQGTMLAPLMLLNSPDRKTINYRFSLPKGHSYKEGDHLAILPQNAPSMVQDVLQTLSKVDGLHYIKVSNEFAPAYLRGGLTFHDIIRDYVDLSAPVPFALTKLAMQYASPGSDAKIQLQFYSLSTLAHTKWLDESNTSVGEFIIEFATVVSRIPLDELLLLCPRISPRLYSISSSNKDIPARVEITVRQAQIGDRLGLCSAYLANVKPGAYVRMYVSPCPAFRLDTSVPTIMIANGWSRWINSKTSSGSPQRVLYYGCRDATELLYDKEIKTSVDHLAVAYSRSPSHPKQYVQDALRGDANRLRALIQNGAKVYVCGSQAMASDVKETIDNLFPYLLPTLIKTGKYVEDIF